MSWDLRSRARRGPRQALDAALGFYFDPVSVHPVALSRWLLGIMLVAAHLLYARDLELIFGPDGLFHHYYTPGKETFLQAHLWAVWSVAVISSGCFAIGLMTRTAGVTAAASQLLFTSLSGSYTWGWGKVAPFFVLYLVLADSGRRWSVDRRLRQWLRERSGKAENAPGPEVDTVAGWAVRLFQIHVCVIYFAAAWHRIDDPGWLYGHMVYEAFSYGLYSRLPMQDWQAWRPLFWILCWGVFVLELFAPIQLWRRRSRTGWAVALIILHLGLELGATVGWWQYLMMASLVIFLPPGWCQRALSTLTPRPWAGPRPPNPEAAP